MSSEIIFEKVKNKRTQNKIKKQNTKLEEGEPCDEFAQVLTKYVIDNLPNVKALSNYCDIYVKAKLVKVKIVVEYFEASQELVNNLFNKLEEDLEDLKSVTYMSDKKETKFIIWV